MKLNQYVSKSPSSAETLSHAVKSSPVVNVNPNLHELIPELDSIRQNVEGCLKIIDEIKSEFMISNVFSSDIQNVALSQKFWKQTIEELLSNVKKLIREGNVGDALIEIETGLQLTTEHNLENFRQELLQLKTQVSTTNPDQPKVPKVELKKIDPKSFGMTPIVKKNP